MRKADPLISSDNSFEYKTCLSSISKPLTVDHHKGTAPELVEVPTYDYPR